MSYLLVIAPWRYDDASFNRLLDGIRQYAGQNSVKHIDDVVLPGDNYLEQLPRIMADASGLLLPVFDEFDMLFEYQSILVAGIELALTSDLPIVVAKVNNAPLPEPMPAPYDQLIDVDFIVVDESMTAQLPTDVANLFKLEAMSDDVEVRSRLTTTERKAFQGDLSQVASAGKINDVFISYSRENSDLVRRLHTGIESAGFTTWVDWNDIALTAPWLDEIFAGIESANTFLIAISPDSMASPICQLEINHALESNRRIIPVVVENVSNIEDHLDDLRVRYDNNTELQSRINRRQFMELARANWSALASLNWVFFNRILNFDDNLRDLQQALETDLDYLRNHARYQNLALEWQRSDSDRSLLLRGDELKRANQWLVTHETSSPPPTQEMRDFFSASDAFARRQRTQALIGGSMVAVVLSIIGVVAFLQFQARVAEETRNQSLIITDFAQEALAQNNSRLGLALALEARNINPDIPQLQRVLVDSALTPMISASFTVDGNHTSLQSIAVSDDEQWLYTGSIDQTIIRWDTATLQPVMRYIAAGSSVTRIRHLAAEDVLIAGTANGQLIFWEGDTPEPVTTLSFADTDAVAEIAYHDDSQQLAVGFTNGMLALVDGTTREIVWQSDVYARRLAFGFDTKVSITGLAFTGNGTHLIVSSEDGTAGNWDVASGTLENETRVRQDSIVDMVLFPGTTEALVTYFDDGWTHINWQTGDIINEARDDTMGNIVLAGQGTIVISDNLRFYSVPDMTLLNDVEGISGRLPTLAAGGDTPQNLYLNVTGTTQIDRISLQTGLVQSQLDLDDDLTRAAISPDGSSIAIVKDRATVRIYNMQTGEFDFFIEAASGGGINVDELAFSADSQQLFITPEDGELKLYDLATGQTATTFRRDDSTMFQPVLVKINPAGETILTTSDSGNNPTAWNLETRTMLDPQPDYATGTPLIFSDSGRLIAISDNSFLRIRDIERNQQLSSVFLSALAVDFSDDETQIVAAGSSLSSWNVNENQISNRVDDIGGTITHVAIVENGPFVLGMLRSGEAIIVDLETGSIVYRQQIHESDTLAMQYDPQRDAYAVVAADGNITWIQPFSSYDDVLDIVTSYQLPPLKCQQIELYNINRDCDAPSSYRTSFEVETLPSPPPPVDATPDSDGEQTAESVVEELASVDVPFDVRVPVTDDLIPDYYFTEVLSPDVFEYIDTASFLAPGGFTIRISYDYIPDSSSFEVYLSESPFATLDEWQQSGILQGLNQRIDVGGTDIFVFINDETMIWTFIYNGTFVGGMANIETLDIVHLGEWIASYLDVELSENEREQFISILNANTLLSYTIDISTSISREELDFTPIYPADNDRFTMVRELTVTDVVGENGDLIEQFLGISGRFYLMEFTSQPDNPDAYNQFEVAVVQALSRHRDTRTWYDSDFIISSVMNLVELSDGTEVMTLAGNEDGVLYFIVKDYVLMVVTTSTARRSAFDFIPLLLSADARTSPPEPTPLPPLTEDQETGILAVQRQQALDVDTRGYIIDRPPQLTADVSGEDNILDWVDFRMPITNGIVSTTMSWGPGATNDRCGLRFRVDYSTRSNYYYLLIDRENTVHFNEFRDGEWQGLQVRNTDAILTGQDDRNTMRLLLLDDTTLVFINDVYIDSFETTMRPGWLGGVAATYEDSDVSYCTFEENWVWNIVE